jgi:hypothetical protein
LTSVNTVLNALAKGDQIKDYQHAARLFVDNNYELQPRYQNLFAVVFNFTPLASKMFNSVEQLEIPMLIKTAGLPSFNVDVQTHNQYNREVHSQHKIHYNPINITFHDDQSDLIRSFLHSYQNFYFKDSQYSQSGGAYSTNDRYAGYKDSQWGMAEGQGRFFKDIKIYSMYQKRFAEYTLINPIISSFGHDNHSYASGQLMEHSMGVNYEAVKYATGFVNNINPKGFGTIHYDTTPSPLGQFGGLLGDTVLFQGGLVDSVGSIAKDLFSGNLLGAVIKGGLIFNEAKNLDLGAVLKKDATRIIGSVLRGENPLNDIIIPTTQGSTSASGRTQSKASVDRTVRLPVSQLAISNNTVVSSSKFVNPLTSVFNAIGGATTLPSNSGTTATPNKISDTISRTFGSGSQIDTKTLRRQELEAQSRRVSTRINNQRQTGNVDPGSLRELQLITDRIDLEFGKEV